jgi:hypothetical protein
MAAHVVHKRPAITTWDHTILLHSPCCHLRTTPERCAGLISLSTFFIRRITITTTTLARTTLRFFSRFTFPESKGKKVSSGYQSTTIIALFERLSVNNNNN